MKSNVRHGMPSCARYGCKRTECLEAQRRAHREGADALRKGIRAGVSCREAALHAGKLEAAGMSAADISELSGVSITQVRYVLHGSVEQVHRTTSEAILGIDIPEYGWDSANDGLANATGTRRRLQALSVQGFPLPALAEGAELTSRTISELRSGSRAKVRLSGLRKIAQMHDRLWDSDPLAMGIAASAVTRAKLWAKEQGWLPTEAWSDISDPACLPAPLNTPRYVALTEDSRELIQEQGYTLVTAATRLGVTSNTLGKAISYYEKKREKNAK